MYSTLLIFLFIFLFAIDDCPKLCTADYRPVCGTNGQTYSNMCGLHSATECDNPCITLKHEGPCGMFALHLYV